MEEKVLDSIVIFTDGACTGNPGPGGWASILAYPEGQVKELGGYDPATTNNRMEIIGTLKALQSLQDRTENVIVYTDSVYVIRGITEWIWAWRNRGWKTSEGNDVSNQDLWQALSAVVAKRKDFGLEWKFVKGHSGVPGNERCDEIAVSYSKKRKIALFEGSLLHYPYAIYDLPPDVELPEPRPREVKKPAHSYMSMLGGIVTRHKSWKGCELRVKGKSGAKFKKAMSPDDEIEIVKAWGLDPKKIQIKDDPR
jgi:ribonuclease HI